MFIPDPDFSPCRIPDSGVKKALDPGSGSATLDFSFLYETIGYVRNFSISRSVLQCLLIPRILSEMCYADMYR
jgi:hypothetical protein